MIVTTASAFSLLFGVALAVPAMLSDTRTETHVVAGSEVGGSGGYPFTDLYFANGEDHKRMATITLSGCGTKEHVSEILIGWRDNDDKSPEPDFLSSVHGSAMTSRTTAKVALARNEYINSVVIYTYKVKDTKMIARLEMSTNLKQQISCGTHQDSGQIPAVVKLITDSSDASSAVSPIEQALLYFSGQHDDALNMLQTHWIPVQDF